MRLGNKRVDVYAFFVLMEDVHQRLFLGCKVDKELVEHRLVAVVASLHGLPAHGTDEVVGTFDKACLVILDEPVAACRVLVGRPSRKGEEVAVVGEGDVCGDE